MAQHTRNELGGGNTGVFRWVEIASILAFGGLSFGVARELALAPFDSTIWGLAFVGGWVFADFFSGLVHWAGDTWGTPQWRIIGKTLIRPFREHHVDASAMGRDDFIEINGSNCLVSLPVLAVCYFLPMDSLAFYIASAIGWSLTLWIFGTNQFHAWAHRSNNPPIITFLQKYHVILNPKAHAKHHVPPHLDDYCITNGWLNGPLRRIRFFRRAEAVVSFLTGAIPREGEAPAPEAATAPRSTPKNDTSRVA